MAEFNEGDIVKHKTNFGPNMVVATCPDETNKDLYDCSWFVCAAGCEYTKRHAYFRASEILMVPPEISPTYQEKK